MDKVRFEDNERLDIPDTNALQDLVYEYVGRVLGALMGRVSGCLDPPTFTVDHNTKTITLTSGLFYHFKIEDSGVTTGKVIRYDTTNSQQIAKTVDYTNAGTSFYIWCRSVMSDAPVQNRKKWVDGGGETAVSMVTRQVETVEFTASASNPAAGDAAEADWFRIGVVSEKPSVAQETYGDAGYYTLIHKYGDYDNDPATTGKPVPRPLYAWDFANNPFTNSYSEDPGDEFGAPDGDEYGLLGRIDNVTGGGAATVDLPHENPASNEFQGLTVPYKYTDGAYDYS